MNIPLGRLAIDCILGGGPAVPDRIVLGMPHLCLGGPSETWLLDGGEQQVKRRSLAGLRCRWRSGAAGQSPRRFGPKVSDRFRLGSWSAFPTTLAQLRTRTAIFRGFRRENASRINGARS